MQISISFQTVPRFLYLLLAQNHPQFPTYKLRQYSSTTRIDRSFQAVLFPIPWNLELLHSKDLCLTYYCRATRAARSRMDYCFSRLSGKRVMFQRQILDGYNLGITRICGDLVVTLSKPNWTKLSLLLLIN